MPVGRNQPCPCGSGLKFKRCCGRTQDIRPHLSRAVGIAIDDKTGQTTVVTEGTLFNQLRRDAPRIAATFDRLCTDDLRSVDRLAARIVFLVVMGRKEAIASESTLREACAHLLMNATITLIAAVDLVRDGFVLQPGMLIRNVLETLTAVICIFTVKSDWEAFQADRLKPETRLSVANRFLPVFGQFYGLFSERFAHVRQWHSNAQLPTDYEAVDEPLSTNLQFVRAAVWLIYVVAEAVFFKCGPAMYWIQLDEQRYEYKPTEDGLALQASLFGPMEAESSAS
jgi:magnesium-transporting ATPase (P-type)